jgi:hypothetical protein
VALVRTNVSEELSTSFIRVTRIGELGTTLHITNNRIRLRRNFFVTSQKTPFFIVPAVKTSNLTWDKILLSISVSTPALGIHSAYSMATEEVLLGSMAPLA